MAEEIGWVPWEEAKKVIDDANKFAKDVLAEKEKDFEKIKGTLSDRIGSLGTDLDEEKKRNDDLSSDYQSLVKRKNEIEQEHGRILQELLLRRKHDLLLFLKVRRPPPPKTNTSTHSVTASVSTKFDESAYTFSLTQVRHDANDYTCNVHRTFVGAKGDDTDSIWHTMKALVERAFQGTHLIILAYGETGSGKTSTLWAGHGEDPRSESLLSHIGRFAFDPSAEDRRGWSLKATWIEVYQDKLYNLVPSSSDEDGHDYTQAIPNPKPNDPKPYIHYHSGLEDYISAKNGTKDRIYLQATEIQSEKALASLCETAMEKRNTSETAANETSSRSNAVLDLYILDQDKTIQGAITMVDMFGTEKVDASSDTRKAERGDAMVDIGDVVTYLSELSKKIKETGASTSRPTLKSERGKLLLRLLLGGLKGKKLQDPHKPAAQKKTGDSLPRIAVLGHIVDSARHDNANKRTMDTLKKWGQHI